VALAAVAAAAATQAHAANVLSDGGFEAQSVANRVGTGDFFVGDACQLDVLFGGSHCRAREPWSANNRVVFLVKGGTEVAEGVASAEGSYHAMLGGGGQLFQYFVAPTSGDYTLSWLEAGGRSAAYSSPLDYFVLVSGEVGGGSAAHVATQFQDFTLREMALTGLVAGASYQLSFVGAGRCCDVGALMIDDVRIEAAGVPEPSTWALLILGFGAVGAGTRRRARAALARA
jgi:hypothetical protein